MLYQLPGVSHAEKAEAGFACRRDADRVDHRHGARVTIRDIGARVGDGQPRHGRRSNKQVLKIRHSRRT